MKANELMIGNWVLCDKNAQSEYEFDNVNYQPYQIRNGEDIDYASERNMIGDADVYQPIPLTGEILEKNGFIHRITDVDGDMYTYKWHKEQQDNVLQYDQYFHVTADPYGGFGFYWLPEMSAVIALHFRYVHELQNIMRMVGINKNITL